MILRKAGLWLALLSLLPATGAAQQRQGELRVVVTDSSGSALEATVELTSSNDPAKRTFHTDKAGQLALRDLDFAVYAVSVSASSFSSASKQVNINSEVPQRVELSLAPAPVNTTVEVVALAGEPGSSGGYSVAPVFLQDHIPSVAGRGISDAVVAQPGWLVEANGALHPRGSEYGVQFVQDGFPFNDNRSPAFSSSPGPEDAESLTVMTANYPAEFGRKLGGIVETNSGRDNRSGFHGRASLDGGSFGTAEENAEGQWATAKGAVKLGAAGLRTERYLDPPTETALHDHGRNINLFANADRNLTMTDNVRFAVWHGDSRFGVPNDLLQEAAVQQQTRDNSETGGNASLRHIFSPNLLGSLRVMARGLTATLSSNPQSTPIMPAQDRGFREMYLSGSIAGQKGRHSWKAGTDVVLTRIRENFSYQITDSAAFDPTTAQTFQFVDQRTAREQSWFVQDNFVYRRFSVSAGVRWDYYKLLVTDNAFSPRIGASWQLPTVDAAIYASYDRIFVTPAMENLLLSSSTAAQRLTDSAAGLPVPPSRGDFYEVGVTKGWSSRFRVNAKYFMRDVRNFADDDLLLNTGVGFPISFSRARIHGWETKIEAPALGKLSGFVSYSNQVGIGILPITGGLLLKENAQSLLHSNDRFPISQDQRNTVHANARYPLGKQNWLAVDAYYGSGLPVEIDEANIPTLAMQYSATVLSRVNFAAGRVRPSSSVDISGGRTIWTHNDASLRLQASVQNVFDRVNVINFAGVLSGTAVAPPRHYGVRARFKW